MLSEQGSRQLFAFVCIHQPDGFKDLLTGNFCCHRLFVLPGLGCCRGQILGIEVGFDLLGQLQPGFVETLLVHTETLANGNFSKKTEGWTVPALLTEPNIKGSEIFSKN